MSDTWEGAEVEQSIVDMTDEELLDHLTSVHYMDIEWRAWQVVMDAFTDTFPDKDVNDPAYNYVVYTIRHWGEMLSVLRQTQTDEIRKRAVTETYKEMLAQREKFVG